MGAYFLKKQARSPILEGFGRNIYALLSFSGQQYLIIRLEYQSFYSPQTQAVQPTHANRTAHVWRLYVTQLWAINLTPFKADY